MKHLKPEKTVRKGQPNPSISPEKEEIQGGKR